jgi:nucleotide-binding universal stress UspA family protein
MPLHRSTRHRSRHACSQLMQRRDSGDAQHTDVAIQARRKASAMPTSPTPPRTSGHNILLGYVPSDEGRAALERARHFAVLEHATLTVVNTGKDGDYANPFFAEPKHIDALQDELDAAGIAHEIRRPTDSASASATLLAVAEEIGADLIVIGVPRRSPVGKLLMGSTAQAVLLGATCPVLAVKPRT